MSPKRKPESGWKPKLSWQTGPDGRVRLNGIDHYCGFQGDPKTIQVYEQKVAEWIANHGAVQSRTTEGVTVAELLSAGGMMLPV